ncbi:MAG: hypothetical protein NVSMB4_02820 [Acidimicrobiales bacterium]
MYFPFEGTAPLYYDSHLLDLVHHGLRVGSLGVGSLQEIQCLLLRPVKGLGQLSVAITHESKVVEDGALGGSQFVDPLAGRSAGKSSPGSLFGTFELGVGEVKGRQPLGGRDANSPPGELALGDRFTQGALSRSDELRWRGSRLIHLCQFGEGCGPRLGEIPSLSAKTASGRLREDKVRKSVRDGCRVRYRLGQRPGERALAAAQPGAPSGIALVGGWLRCALRPIRRRSGLKGRSGRKVTPPEGQGRERLIGPPHVAKQTRPTVHINEPLPMNSCRIGRDDVVRDGVGGIEAADDGEARMQCYPSTWIVYHELEKPHRLPFRRGAAVGPAGSESIIEGTCWSGDRE